MQTPGTEPPLGTLQMGEGTYYGAAGSGNCSYEASPNDLLVAAMNDPQYNNSSVCGMCVDVTGPKGMVTVRIVDLDEGRALNRDYRKKDYATNVLTFDYAHAPVVVADLVLCAPVVEQEAREQGKTLQAHYAHLLVHGTLHAQGWDHETSEADAQEMEAYETAILQELGYADPYAP